MPSVLVTGANRGLGLELVSQYLDAGWTAIACCRQPDQADALHRLAKIAAGRLRIEAMDVNDAGQVASVAKALDGKAIDLLINNAGIADSYGIGVFEGKDDPDLKNYDFDIWLEVLRTNVLSPGRVTGEFADHVARSEKKMIVMMASGLSSLANTWRGGRYAYRTSKAALNMVMRGAGAWLEPRGITVVSIAPGWTRTDLGGPSAPNSVGDAVTGMRAVLDRITLADTGSYWNFDGERLPW